MANLEFVIVVAYMSLVIGTGIKFFRLGLRGVWLVLAVFMPLLTVAIPLTLLPTLKYLSTKADSVPVTAFMAALREIPTRAKVKMFLGLFPFTIANYPVIANLLGRSVLRALSAAVPSLSPDVSRPAWRTVVENFAEETMLFGTRRFHLFHAHA